MTKELNLSFLHKLRVLGIIEGTSTLLLFGVAMPLKYMADMPMAVKIMGSLHGFLFLALVVMSVLAIRKVPLGFLWGLVGVLLAIIPFGPFLMELHLRKLAKTAG